MEYTLYLLYAGPLLKMTSSASPEVKTITIRADDLTTALSNDPLGVAGILLSKGFISEDILLKIHETISTSTEKATILTEAIRDKIGLVPTMFPDLLEILSGVSYVKEVVKGLRSTYDSEL